MTDGYNPEDTIFVRIDKAFQEIAAKGLKKSKTAGTGSYAYKFIPISDILDVVRPAHAKYGVKVIPSRVIFDGNNCETRTLTNGKFLANGHIVFRIVGKSMEDSFEASISCEALDNSDKTTNKLLTNAERGLYRAMYGLDEGDDTDPEAFHVKLNEEEPKPKTVPPVKKTDSFFGRPSAKAAPTSQSASLNAKDSSAALDEPTDKEIFNALLGVKDPKVKDMIAAYMRDNGIMSVYETLPEQRLAMYNMVRSVA